MADINLVPQEEKQEQVKVKVVRTSTIISIILFVVAAGVGGYLFYQADQIKNEISEHDDNINSLRRDIQGLAEIEVVARNLDQRFETLEGILNTREHYSLLLSEFLKRVPDNMEIETFGTGRGNTVNVSGKGDDYIAIARFINDVSDPDFPEAATGLGALFSDVSLNSVNLDVQTNKARFFIVLTIEESLLKK